MLVVNAHGFTDYGRLRQQNEDGFGAWTHDGLFAVCDGMGGGRTGDIPTAIALAAIHEGFCAEPLPGDYRTTGPRGLERLEAAVKLANKRVFDKSKSAMQYQGIGAAIAAMSVEGDMVFIAHAGDCRIYRFRTSTLAPLTEDHSLINDVRKQHPDVTEEELANLKHIITRALGIQAEVTVTMHHEQALPGDLYLLCTDGIHGMIGDDKIAMILGADANIADIANALLDAALEAGGEDNIAVVLVRFSRE